MLGYSDHLDGCGIKLFFGLAFYILTSFIFKVDIHFIHLWGIEFILNLIIMFVVSWLYPRDNIIEDEVEEKVNMKGWKYTPHLSVVLVVVTILIYILLGQ